MGNGVQAAEVAGAEATVAGPRGAILGLAWEAVEVVQNQVVEGMELVVE